MAVIPSQRLLFWTWYGLGDCAEMTRAMYAAAQLGHRPAAGIWSPRNSDQMAAIWRALPWLRVLPRTEFVREEWDAIMGHDNAKTLPGDCTGIPAKAVYHFSWGGGSFAQAWIDQLLRLGHTPSQLPAMAPAPLAHLLPPGPRDAILIAPGTGGDDPPAVAKRYTRWAELVPLLPPPHYPGRRAVRPPALAGRLAGRGEPHRPHSQPAV